jgi:PAS domain S-box-containing protein
MNKALSVNHSENGYHHLPEDRSITFDGIFNCFSNCPHPESKTMASLLDDLAEGVILADTNGKFVFFNAAAATILGIGAMELDPVEWSKSYGCFYPDKVTAFPSEKLPLSRVINGSDSCSEVIFIKNPNKPDGLFIEVSSSPIRNHGGVVIGGSAVFKDISKRTLAEEKLKRSEVLRRSLFLENPVPIYVWQNVNDDFILVDFNNAASDITSGRLKDFTGVKLSILYKRRPDIIDDFHKCFTSKDKIVRQMEYEVTIVNKILNFITSYVYVEPDIVMVHTLDITELERSEKQIKLLSNAVEQTEDSIVITNLKGLIEFVNPAFSVITGYSREEVLGNSPKILKSGLHDIDFYKNIWETILNGDAYHGAIINKKKNGAFFTSQQTITPMKDKGGNITHFVSVQKDITNLLKQQEIEFQLKVARALQERLYNNNIEIPGYDIAGHSYSALETSGDYYDCFYLPDGSIALVIGDVTGHGLGPAMVMVETRSCLRAFAASESNPGVLLELLNKVLCSDLHLDYFVTLLVIRLDLNSSTIDYAGAGHELGYLMNPSGEIKFILESMGIPLGYDPNFKYNSSISVKIEPDDSIIMLTDGIKDALSPDNNRFGEERLISLLRNNVQLDAQAQVKNVYDEVGGFIQNMPQEDDITMMVCKRKAI